MVDAIFAHPRLAAIYDAFDGERDDLAPYLGIAQKVQAQSVLDIGCGTGSLALLLARSKMTVIGVDPAEASLKVAQAKAGATKVTWVQADATTLPPLAVDLAVMTGNVAQVFLTNEMWTATLRGIYGALAGQGHLVFETRRPERKAWKEWARDTDPVILHVPAVGEVEQRREVTDIDLPFVSFRYTYRFASDGFEATSESTLRFRTRDEVEATLLANGYSMVDVREAPDRPGREYVFIAQSTREFIPDADGWDR